MNQPLIRIATLGTLGACIALAGFAACRPATEPAPEQEQQATAQPGILRNPCMAGERWGMPPEEIAAAHGSDPVLQSPSSDYYMSELDGRPVLAQYVFSPATDDAPRGLVRKIIHLASPKRQRFLPLLSGSETQAAYRSLHALMEALHGPAPVEESPMAVSDKLESQARVAGDRVATAEREVRALEHALESRRKELQRQYAGQKNRNAMVAAGLLDLERPLQQAQRKLLGYKNEQHQIQNAIREECAVLPEAERPYHWQSDWEAPDGTASLYLTSNARGNYLALSFTAPE